ncbi:hypothetical protein Fmac_021065 [Flemingia macrophylla]|uniref:Zeta toxin domain-containing protein n=1 Tax=Flemingia macrophylla TaxID=520843 RepID=A0ABD1LVU1_9FABA
MTEVLSNDDRVSPRFSIALHIRKLKSACPTGACCTFWTWRMLRTFSSPAPTSIPLPSPQVMAPVANSDRSPLLLFMGGGMGAGKSTVVKDILKDFSLEKLFKTWEKKIYTHNKWQIQEYLIRFHIYQKSIKKPRN